MLPIVKCLAMALALLAVGGCACRDALVLKCGEKVDSLYYHECRMPDEIMVEMWIDFDSRRFRFKCGLHDAMGWESSRFDSVRMDLVLEDHEWRKVLKHLCKANVESWPNVGEMRDFSPVDKASYYVRLRSGDKATERFAASAPPKGIGEMQSVIQFALSHKALCLWPGEMASSVKLPANAELR